MAVTDCNYPVLGKFKAVAIGLADSCGRPVEGIDAMWVDQCPGAFAYSEDVDEGEDFTRRCADGSTLVAVPGVDALKGYDLELDLPTADPGLWSAASGATPVVENGDTIGWDVCAGVGGSVSVYVWRELVGDGACDPAGGGPDYLVSIFPWVDGVRVVEQGTFGNADAFLRLTGTARTGHAFGKGALPLVPDAADPVANPPTCFTDPIASSCAVRHVVTSVGWPDVCGFTDVTACA